MTRITVQVIWERTSFNHHVRGLGHAALQVLTAGGASTGWLVAAYVVGCEALGWFVAPYSGGCGALCWGAGAGVSAPVYR